MPDEDRSSGRGRLRADARNVFSLRTYIHTYPLYGGGGIFVAGAGGVAGEMVCRVHTVWMYGGSVVGRQG